MRQILDIFWRHLCAGSLAVAALAPFDGADAATFQVLHVFTGGSDGSSPQAGLVRAKSGDLFGTAAGGGTFGCGVVFKISANGIESVLHAFECGTDGATPRAGVVIDKMGNLYGTTQDGGGDGCNGGGCGTVFKIASDGTEIVLHAFSGGEEGAGLFGPLILDKAGSLYGMTYSGGGTDCGGQGCGTIFKLAPNGSLTVLYAFKGASDGSGSQAGLVRDKTGNLFGTTTAGGGTGCAGGRGCGTAFVLTKDGTETVLHAFTGGKDGGYPSAALIKDAAGNFFSTTPIGGKHDYGTVFKLTPDGAETVLHSFSGKRDGGEPNASLIADMAGNLYGTTTYGGAYNWGTAFKLAPDGTESVLISFRGKKGAIPLGALAMGPGGELYGTTNMGGGNGCSGYGCGLVFKLSPS